jgi:hypothetical protein
MPDEPGLTAAVNWGSQSVSMLAGRPSLSAAGSFSRSTRVKMRSLEGVVAYRMEPGVAKGFTPVPVEDMTPGRYDYAILPTGREVQFHYIDPASTGNDTLQAACASKTGVAIVSVETEIT